MNSFMKAVEAFINLRQESLYENEVLSDEYNNSRNAARIKLDYLHKNMPEDLVKVLYGLADDKINMELASNTEFYKKGFSDGAKTILHILIA